MPGSGEVSLPAQEELTGPGAAEVLTRVLPPGTRIRSLVVRQVLSRPGRRVSVRYDAQIEWPDRPATAEAVVAYADRSGLPDGPPRVEVAGDEVAIWFAADDPYLPGMGVATSVPSVLEAFGVLGVPASTVALTLRAYRPGRRAVIEAVPDDDGPRVYLKVLPAEEAADVAERYARLAAAGLPVARGVLVADGVLALEGLPGETLGRCFRKGLAVPQASEVAAMVAALAALDLPGEPVRDAEETIERHATLLRSILPDERDRIDRIVAAVGQPSLQPIATIHGDLHEGQILVEDGRLSGLLDVDDAGPGELVDDVGQLVGRLWVLGDKHPEARRYAEELFVRFASQLDESELRRRTLIALLGRATGPYRNNLPEWRRTSTRRLALADAWASSMTI
jgi:Phosphotransferase enzyme family